MTGWVILGVSLYVLSHLYIYREGHRHGREEMLGILSAQVDELEAATNLSVETRQALSHEIEHMKGSE